MPRKRFLSMSVVLLSVPSLLAITGCGAAAGLDGTSAATPAESITGTVHGGQQNIVGATVALFAPATSGYGNAPTLIVTASSTTGSNGSFTLPRPYTCPANSGDVYILSTGGNPGTSSGANNAIVLATLLGPCSSLSASTKVEINEATTVAAAYALAPFAIVSAAGTGIGTSATNLTGLNNAYGPATNLVNPNTGSPNLATSLSGMILPTTELDTIANVLAYCVDSTTSGPCTALFSAATPPNGTAPKDTFQAALDVALNPGNNVAKLFALAGTVTPFQPTLSAVSDFALGIQYTGGILLNCGFTTGVAIDAQGDAWVGCGTDVGTQGINEISPSGVFLSGSTGYLNKTLGQVSGGNGIAIDKNGLVDVTAASQNAVFQLSSSGTVLNKFTASSLAGPTGIAVDNITGWIWVANTNNQPSLDGGAPDYTGTTVSALTAAGVDSQYSPYAPTLATGPVDIEIGSIDNIGTIFTANNTTNSLAAGIALIFAPSSSTPGSYNGGEEGVVSGAALPRGQLAFDASNNLWFTSNSDIMENPYISGQIYGLGNTTVDIPQTVTPISLMFDGLNRLFVANAASTSAFGSITSYTSAGALISPTNGYTANGTVVAQPYAPTGFDIDSSGNVWVTGSKSSSQAVVTELIGLAAPVKTPKSVSSSTAAVATRP